MSVKVIPTLINPLYSPTESSISDPVGRYSVIYVVVDVHWGAWGADSGRTVKSGALCAHKQVRREQSSYQMNTRQISYITQILILSKTKLKCIKKWFINPLLSLVI